MINIGLHAIMTFIAVVLEATRMLLLDLINKMCGNISKSLIGEFPEVRCKHNVQMLKTDALNFPPRYLT